MSLLLDALKKAADDKQKASSGGSSEPNTPENNLSDQEGDTNSVVASTTEATSQKTEEPVPPVPEKNTGSLEELTLDPIENNTVVASEPAAVEVPASDPGNISDAADEMVRAQASHRKDRVTTSYTVSDEALTMLIYKTNREAKRNRRVMLVSVLLLSLGVLVSGGVYYYMNMQTEIAFLERKHQIATLSMQSKVSTNIAPEKSEIIRNLVGESDLDEKVQFAKKQMAVDKKQQYKKQRPVETKNNNAATPATVSFLKTNKADPVTEKLDRAWQAYDTAQYAQARELYEEVMQVEKTNRDAMLGLGAIAVIEKNNNEARSIYLALLKQDPRDPIAISALASLRNNSTAPEQDEKYLSAMLQKNPDDAHLNFALGNVYAQQNKWKQAQQSYFNAWQQDNENADYIFNLAVSMDQLGKPAEASGLYQSCLDRSAGRQVSFSREAVQKRISELAGAAN